MSLLKLQKKSPLILTCLLACQSQSVLAWDSSNSTLMTATIWGAVGSLGYACYLGTNPCGTPKLNLNKRTLSFDTGQDSTIKHQRISLGADWQDPLYQSANFAINGRWEVNANRWHSIRKDAIGKSGYVFGLAPVFNYQYLATNWPVIPTLQLGGGPQYLSTIRIENEYKSTQFQFASIFGLGITHRDFELGYRYLHISNANISEPNPGTDFHNVHLAYRF